MKKINYILAAIIFLTACGKDDSNDLGKESIEISSSDTIEDENLNNEQINEIEGDTDTYEDKYSSIELIQAPNSYGEYISVDYSDIPEQADPLTKKDIFHNKPFKSLVNFDDEGYMINENQDTKEEVEVSYVNYSDNIYVEIYDKLPMIYKLSGNGKYVLYQGFRGENIIPIGQFDEKIYFWYNINRSNPEYENYDDGEVLIETLAVLDLKTGEVNIYNASNDIRVIGGAFHKEFTVEDNKLIFTAHRKKSASGKEQLLSLDLSKGYDQDAEVLEKDYKPERLHTIAFSNVLINENGNSEIRTIYADQINEDSDDRDMKEISFGSPYKVENYIISIRDPNRASISPNYIDVYDVRTGENVLETEGYAVRVNNNKLYYIDEEEEIQIFDLEWVKKFK